MPPPAVCRTCLVLLAAAGAAAAGPPATDANLVTGIDVSASVSIGSVLGELQGIADAIREPGFLAAVRRGGAGRIGFAVFVWHETQAIVVPWTEIASAADAEAAARRLESPAASALAHTPYEESLGKYGCGTDLSQAMEFARALLATAPAGGERTVVNIVGNGMDNVGESAAAARNRLLATGATVNGVVFGGDLATQVYFRSQVIGGDGAFLLAADPETGIAAAMQRKFLQDLVAALPARRSPPPQPLAMAPRPPQPSTATAPRR